MASARSTITMDCKHCHRTCDITTIYQITILKYCPYCGVSQIPIIPPSKGVIHLPVDTPVTDFLNIKDKFLDENLPKISGYLKSVMNDYMHKKMIDSAVAYYKRVKEFAYTPDGTGRVLGMSEIKDTLIRMYNRYYNAHRGNMIPSSVRIDPDPEFKNFKYRLENFVMNDLNIVKSDIDKSN